MNNIKETIKTVESEKDKVDNYIITTCITLIGSFIIIFSIHKPSDKISIYSFLLTLFFLIISFFFFLWDKIRHSKRMLLFEKAKNEIFSKTSREIGIFIEDFALPADRGHFLGATLPDKKTPSAKISPIEYEKDIAEKREILIMVHLEKMEYQLKEKGMEIFNKPIEENYAKVKNTLDLLARKYRYFTFTLALIFFFISVFLSLI